MNWVPWVLGAILGAVFLYPVGRYARWRRVPQVEPVQASPCVDEIYANLERLTLRSDRARDDLRTVEDRMAKVESRMQLVDQEWADHYSKSRAIEERLAKRDTRQKARERREAVDAEEDDSMLAALMAGEGAQPEGANGVTDPATAAFLLKRQRG